MYDKSEINKNIFYKFNNNRKESEYGVMHEESQQNEITQIGLVENINKNALDLNSDIQAINGKDLNDNKVVDKLVSKKYKVNNKLPMIVLSISVNLNTNDFLKLIKDNFIKLNYKNIMNIKSTLYDNVDIYEYNTKNIFQQMVYCIFNEKAFIKNLFQVTTILQKDENNFTNGLNYFLNDNYERKLAIKTIKGSEKNIITFMIKYLKLIACSVNKIKIIKQSKSLFKYNIEQILNEQIQIKKNTLLKNINIPQKKILLLDNEETLVEKSNKKVNRFFY